MELLKVEIRVLAAWNNQRGLSRARQAITITVK